MSRIKQAETGLTQQQEAFAQAVASGKTQRAAYMAAYPASHKHRIDVVDNRASKLAATPKVAARIKALTETVISKAVERIAFDRATVLEEIARIAFSDVGSLFDEQGRLRPIHSLTAAERASISSFELQTDTHYDGNGEAQPVTTIKVRLWNKGDALERLCRHLGLYEADNKQKGGTLFEGLPRPVVLQVMALIERLMEEHAGNDPGRPGEVASLGASGTTH